MLRDDLGGFRPGHYGTWICTSSSAEELVQGVARQKASHGRKLCVFHKSGDCGHRTFMMFSTSDVTASGTEGLIIVGQVAANLWLEDQLDTLMHCGARLYPFICIQKPHYHHSIPRHE